MIEVPERCVPDMAALDELLQNTLHRVDTGAGRP